MEDFHCLHALVELDVLEELVEGLVELEEELDDARELEIFVLEFLSEVLPLVHGLVGFGRLRLDSNRVELVAPQVLERHGVVVLDIVSASCASWWRRARSSCSCWRCCCRSRASAKAS